MLRRSLEFTQYLAVRYTERLAQARAVASVGSRGDSYDNALAESFNGLYKTELIRKDGPWRGLEDVEYATLEWVDWFNQRRLHTELGMVPPAEFEAVQYHEEAQASLAVSPPTRVSTKLGAVHPPAGHGWAVRSADFDVILLDRVWELTAVI